VCQCLHHPEAHTLLVVVPRTQVLLLVVMTGGWDWQTQQPALQR
jgi:hypothetical protein